MAIAADLYKALNLFEISRSRVQLSPGAFLIKMDIKKYYEGMNKDLPSFEGFNAEFEIDDIEKGNFALHIACRMVDKTEKFRKILEEYLHADGSSIAVLMEIKGMDDMDKEKINHAYKELILIERDLSLAEIENNEHDLIDHPGANPEKSRTLIPAPLRGSPAK